MTNQKRWHIANEINRLGKCITSQNRKFIKIVKIFGLLLVVLWVVKLLYENDAESTLRKAKVKYRNSRAHGQYGRKNNGIITNGTENSIESQFEFDKNWAKRLQSLYFPETSTYQSVNCLGVINGESKAIKEAVQLRNKLFSKEPKDDVERSELWIEQMDNSLMKQTGNCSDFLLSRKYITSPLTFEEEAYPIAYIILIYNKFSMFERLLRSIYQPQNLYCIHVDKRSPKQFIEGVKKFSDCFSNVFVASKLTEVYYTHWSRVEADINCMKNLVQKASQVSWSYVINLCGQDFPLKTNLEIVRSLKSLRGYNNMESCTVPFHKIPRFKFKHVLPEKINGDHDVMINTFTKKSPSPLNISMFSGGAYYIWKREAVEFMLHDSLVQSFFEWNKDSSMPEEHVWATLQRWYPRVPGSYPSRPEYDLNQLQSISRVQRWMYDDETLLPKCAGLHRRSICVFGTGDLSWLLKMRHLFANKFDFNVDPYAIECLDIRLRNQTILQTFTYLSQGFLK